MGDGTTNTSETETLTITKDLAVVAEINCYEEEGEVRLRITADEPVVQVLSAHWRSTESSPSAERICRFKESLAADGFVAAASKPSTYETSFEFDLSTGTVLALPTRAVDDAAPPNASIDASVFAAVQRAAKNLAQHAPAKIVEALAKDDQVGAATAFLEASMSTDDLFAVASKIDIARLEDAEAAKVLVRRVAVAAELPARHVALLSDSELLLGKYRSHVAAEMLPSIQSGRAIGFLFAGQKEVAFTIWRGLIENDELPSGERAWVYRNLSLMLETANPDAARYAELSADAFLSEGDRKEAAASTVRLANCLLATSPATALAKLDEVLTWFDTPNAMGARDRAGLDFQRAEALFRLHRWEEAAQAASSAALRLNDVRGIEEFRAAALSLAGIAAGNAGMSEASVFEAEAKAIRDQFEDAADPMVVLRKAIEAGDQDALEMARTLAADAGDGRVEALALIQQALASKDLPLAIQRLENARAKLVSAHAALVEVSIADYALGLKLQEMGETARALPYFERVLAHDPLHSARTNLVNGLWQLKEWKRAVLFLEKELERLPDDPATVYGLGRSLLEAGDGGRAARFLQRAIRLAGDDDTLKQVASDLLVIALEQGARVEVEPKTSAPEPVTRAMLEECLTDFKNFIQTHKRMTFWVAVGNGDHKWASEPEGLAQDLFHTFIKARLGESVEVFEELATGAGRLDVMIACAGGLRAIVELKMLGKPYSTSYAFSGTNQIAHYMEQRGCHLGYLIIFDGRARDFGKGLQAVERVGASTIMIRFIDLRRSAKGAGRDPIE